MQDILNSRSWHSITSGNGFKQDSDSWRKGGVFRFTLSYNFGNMKASKQKQQRPSEEMNIMEEEFYFNYHFPTSTFVRPDSAEYSVSFEPGKMFLPIAFDEIIFLPTAKQSFP